MSWIESLEGEADAAADENPAPQAPPGQYVSDAADWLPPCPDPEPLLGQLVGGHQETAQDRLAVMMVGLPACGKTHIGRRIKTYLEFFHGIPVEIFNVGNYRRRVAGARQRADFFDPDNKAGFQLRIQCRDMAMADMKEWLGEENRESGPNFGRVAIFDATNTTRERRRWALQQLQPLGVKVMFIESICNDKGLILRNIMEVKLRTPDYVGVAVDDAVKDFMERRDNYNRIYEPIDLDGSEKDLSYIKILNLQEFTVHRVRSYVQGRIVQLLIHAQIAPRTVYLTRPGQNEYDVDRRIGGDSRLTEEGREFGSRLGRFAVQSICRDDDGEDAFVRLWASTLQSAKETAAYIIKAASGVATGVEELAPLWRRHSTHDQGVLSARWLTNLDDIYTGLLDGMTLEEIEQDYPEEARRRRQQPMGYRFPRGESYMDVVHRLEPIVHEIERHKEPLLVVAHKAVLRVLYCYLTGRDREEAPTIEVPLHTVVRIRLHSSGFNEDHFDLSCPNILRPRVPTGAAEDDKASESVTFSRASTPGLVEVAALEA